MSPADRIGSEPEEFERWRADLWDTISDVLKTELNDADYERTMTAFDLILPELRPPSEAPE